MSLEPVENPTLTEYRKMLKDDSLTADERQKVKAQIQKIKNRGDEVELVDESPEAKRYGEFVEELFEYTDSLPITTAPKGVHRTFPNENTDEGKDAIREWLTLEIVKKLMGEVPSEGQIIEFDKVSKSQWAKVENLIHHVCMGKTDSPPVKNFDDLFAEYKNAESISSGYGIHQENRSWIVSTFEKVRPKFDSENKAVKEVKKLYKEQFGLNIGDTTIRRYNDLID